MMEHKVALIIIQAFNLRLIVVRLGYPNQDDLKQHLINSPIWPFVGPTISMEY